MVCTANDLLEWKDFPKGLRVLLLDEDRNSASEIKTKLEQMDYNVSVFFTEHEAMSAISNKTIFHVAIVEVNIHNSDGRYKILETAKDIPTIMTSKEECLSTMMKCIALGAVEFLRKPLSEEKLRNIWQHVVHKAFNASGNDTSESLKSVKEFVGSVLEIQQQSTATQHQIDPEILKPDDLHQSNVCDKFPAPSTPQLRQGGRCLDEGDYQDHINCSPTKESGEVEDETKSVDTTHSNNWVASMEVDPPLTSVELTIKEEDGCADVPTEENSLSPTGCADVPTEENNLSPAVQENEDVPMTTVDAEVSNKEAVSQNSCRVKSNRRKMKVDWTPDLHKKFVQAVEKLGVDLAIPSRILDLMKVEGLTRHNVASHLQKYRMHRRHILPKQEERRWPHPRDPGQKNYYPLRPVMAYPPYHPNHTIAPGHVHPMWGAHGGQPPGYPMWYPPPPSYPWRPLENWQLKSYQGMHADAWGCPVMPPPPCPSSAYSQQIQPASPYAFHNHDSYVKSSSADTLPGEEVIDKAVKEAISKPWLPLPIGLKPPSTDSVLAELSRQGISAIPPYSNGCQSC